ncbi:E3 ubiquitin-protein ligase TRIM39-like isoform X7 [Gouania willdenowi]|uniref:E3 ubiquitin-protein ligase TRIM39-like isoform X7 n=1 Tax=Gouania willdenowi TaxID=441366 RepID=UPI001054C6EF|nr:E3 ubiquitin-protein ligase TRIM39-like isoform X7 [Gouania willdenowi]XP_028329847.1 E3 ubiquitin-protein ligase TRIM39-like isoform X7 [Gouania willdenowi]
MSAACSGTSEDHFLCSICLEVLTDPVTTSCGHNFCEPCISTHWDTSTTSRCPVCNQVFSTKPQLKVNIMMREMVSQFRRESEQKAAAPGEVPCDVCTGTKVKALKSCLDCVISYCETHLEPHLTASGLRRHQLVEPVENLETRMCLKHSKPLELFCQSDQTCVCLMCSVLEHKSHQLVPLREECEEKKVELVKTDADLQQMIQKRREKLEEIRESVRIRKDAADRGKAEGVEMFTALMELVQRGLKELMETMEEKQEAEEKEAEGLIKELEEEISELMKRSSEVEQLSRSEDHLHLLQHFCSLKAPPATKDWTEVMVRPSSYEETVLRAVTQLEDTLSDKMMKMKMKMMKMMQQFAVDVTLDPLTAHPNLVLSDDGKQVYHSDEKKKLPDNKERFSKYFIVLGKQSFSSGRFYFEVQVKGKTKWSLGVVKESINRKEKITATPKNGYWTVILRDGNVYTACDDPSVILHLKCVPEKVGVFVDYEEGVVSFYDVDAAALIYSFTHCCFTHKLHPFFCPSLNYGGKNSSPLIICPVNQSE